MRLKQYRYPFLLTTVDSGNIPAGTPYIRVPQDMTITHLGIQVPFRPFISYRHDKTFNDLKDKPVGPCVADIRTSTGQEYIINIPGILEFDNLSRSDQLALYFILLEDNNMEEATHVKDVLRRIIIDVGYE